MAPLDPSDRLTAGDGVVFGWGRRGLAEGRRAGGVVVVDVLSFTTAVSVATGRGTACYPFHGPPQEARRAAARHRAVCAGGRRDWSPTHPWCLSPAALAAAPPVSRLLLPSPNGSALSAAATVPVVAGCLRNAGAVAAWLLGRGFGTPARPLSVVAAGERWPDGSLRPAREDWLGAGVLLGHLADAGRRLAPAAAAAAVAAAVPDLPGAVRASLSAGELRTGGWAADVEMAVAVDADGHVPVLRRGAFRAG